MSIPFKSISSTGIRKFKCINCKNQAISYTSTQASTTKQHEMCNTCTEAAGVKSHLPLIIVNQSDNISQGPPSSPLTTGKTQSWRQKILFRNKAEKGDEFETAPPEIAEEKFRTFANIRKYLFPSSVKDVEGQRQLESFPATASGLETLKSASLGSESKQGAVAPCAPTGLTGFTSQTFSKQSKQEPSLSPEVETKRLVLPTTSSPKMASKKDMHESSSLDRSESKITSRTQSSSPQAPRNQKQQEPTSSNHTKNQRPSQPRKSTPQKPASNQNQHNHATRKPTERTIPSPSEASILPISSHTQYSSPEISTYTSLAEPHSLSPAPKPKFTPFPPPPLPIDIPEFTLTPLELSPPRILFQEWSFLTPLLHPPLTQTPLTHLHQSLLSYETQYLIHHATRAQLLEFLTMKSVILREVFDTFDFIPGQEMKGLVVGWQEWRSVMGVDEGGYERELGAVGGEGCVEVRRFRREWDAMVERLRGDFEGLC